MLIQFFRKKALKIVGLLLLLVSTGVISAQAEMTDYDAIVAPGHPTYYGNNLDAHSVWDGMPKGKILFIDKFDQYQKGKTIICLSGHDHKKDSMIRDLEVYFMNCEPVVKVTLDDALEIARTYLPWDVINSYYVWDDSYFLPDDNPNEGEYVVRYKLTEEAGEAYYKNEHDYSGTLTVVLYANTENYIDYFTIGMSSPRWVYHTSEALDWHYDFQ